MADQYRAAQSNPEIGAKGPPVDLRQLLQEREEAAPVTAADGAAGGTGKAHRA